MYVYIYIYIYIYIDKELKFKKPFFLSVKYKIIKPQQQHFCVSVHYQNHRMLHDRVGHRAVFPVVFFKDFLFCKWLTIGSVVKLFVLCRQISEVNFGQTIYPKIVLTFLIKTEEGRSHDFCMSWVFKVFIPRLSLLCREKPVYHFIHHKSHLDWPRIELGSPW
jgi:hypothetical protein